VVHSNRHHNHGPVQLRRHSRLTCHAVPCLPATFAPSTVLDGARATRNHRTSRIDLYVYPVLIHLVIRTLHRDQTLEIFLASQYLLRVQFLSSSHLTSSRKDLRSSKVNAHRLLPFPRSRVPKPFSIFPKPSNLRPHRPRRLPRQPQVHLLCIYRHHVC
jgi:hypothetical protein